LVIAVGRRNPGYKTMNADNTREAMRAWVRSAITATGLSDWAFAARAGLATSTITRFLNQPVKHLLSARTLSKISAAADAPVPGELLSASVQERSEIDRALLQIALAEARRALRGVESDDFSALEAETVANIYDRLSDALDDSIAVTDAVKMIRAEFDRQRRAPKRR
jgi:transcriptional regulator with XRE-family HTH domain